MRTTNADSQIDRLITSRSVSREEANALAEMCGASERKHLEKLREQHRWDWIRYFECLAASHRGLSEHFAAKAARLLERGEQ